MVFIIYVPESTHPLVFIDEKLRTNNTGDATVHAFTVQSFLIVSLFPVRIVAFIYKKGNTGNSTNTTSHLKYIHQNLTCNSESDVKSIH